MKGRLGYVPALDGVRALAIVAVVMHHAFRLPFGGGLGVDLFFVLSGFLITTLLLEERLETGRVRIGSFYARRARRLLPALVVFLAGYLVIAALKGQDGLLPVAKAGFYTANFVAAFGPWQASLDTFGLGHLWSLAEEEQFYLVWPFVLLLLMRSRHVTRWLSILVLALVTYRLALVVGHLASARHIFYSPDTRSEGLAAGALLAVVRTRRPTFAVGERVARASICVAFLCIFLVGDRGLLRGIGLLVFELAAVGIVAAAVSPTELAGALASRPLVWLGRISYSLYLWHMPIIWALLPNDALAAIPISVGIAWLSYRYVEQPFRRRRARSASTALARQPAVQAEG